MDRPPGRAPAPHILAIAVIFAILAPDSAVAQVPDSFTNLQYFPKDFPRDSLIGRMRGFSFALGVRCQYCHVGGDGRSFEDVRFASDEDPDKRKARFMLRMMEDLNRNVLPQLPERDDPPVEIQCKTCHRGLERPILLTQELALVLDRHGADSAVAHYRLLRDQAGMRGAYDFGEWEMNTLGERLEAAGRTRDAIAIYRLNAEFFPESGSIAFSLGRLYEALGDTAAAVGRYQRVLELQPDHRGARARLDRLRPSGG